MNSIIPLIAICFQAGAPQELGKCRVADRLSPVSPAYVHVDGFLGRRIESNRTGRLMQIPMDEILDGFQHRPGKHPWIGEHIGKWVHAGTLAWQYSGDAKLESMLHQAVKDLLATQEADGYLGTYVSQERWTSWDVWVHKYDLIGLMSYHVATGDAAALRGARRVGDLLVETFGPDKRDIIAAGTHVGMASTSVLEPMVQLYRLTGDLRYLAFCEYIVESWEKPEGPQHAKRPKVLTSLLSHGKVNQTANHKAYEMMSNLVGLCELYRAAGDERYLQAARAAWEDIAAHQRYITGGTSFGEHFQPDGHLPDTGSVAETCANVTWMQLSMQLLALTGETKYADAIEQLIYNHLLGAQADDGNDWCYFTVLEGIKQFTQNVNCCHSSGPRGVAMIPAVFYGTAAGSLRINLYGESKFRGEVPGVGRLEVRQRTAFPQDGRIAVEVLPGKPGKFRLELRIPPWSAKYSLTVNGESSKPQSGPIAVIDREWRSGDIVTLELDMTPAWIRGSGEHEGELAARNGPFVLCASKRWNPSLRSMLLVGVEGTPAFEAAKLPAGTAAEPDPMLAAFTAKLRTSAGIEDARVVLGPFALVQQEKLAVWLPEAQSLAKLDVSLLFDGRQSVSRRGDMQGSITDGDPATFGRTCNGAIKTEDAWEVTLDEPVEVKRVVFRHGRVFSDGGWFDTSAGQPQVLVRKEIDGAWETVGSLKTYPQTTAEAPPLLSDGQPFELRIAPTRVYGVRVVGKPSCGDKPKQTFSSCAELAAFGE